MLFKAGWPRTRPSPRLTDVVHRFTFEGSRIYGPRDLRLQSPNGEESRQDLHDLQDTMRLARQSCSSCKSCLNFSGEGEREFN